MRGAITAVRFFTEPMFNVVLVSAGWGRRPTPAKGGEQRIALAQMKEADRALARVIGSYLLSSPPLIALARRGKTG